MKESRFYVAAISVYPKNAGLFRDSIKRVGLAELMRLLVDRPTASETLIMDNKKIIREYFVARIGRKAVRDYALHDEVEGFKKVRAVEYPYANIVIDTGIQLGYFEYVYSLNYDVSRFLVQFDRLVNGVIADHDHEIASHVQTDKAKLEERMTAISRIRRIHYELLPPNRISQEDVKELLYAARAAGVNQSLNMDLASKGSKQGIDRSAPLIEALDEQVRRGGGSATYQGYDEEGQKLRVRTREAPRKKSVSPLKKLEEMSDDELDSFLRGELTHGEQ